MLVVFTSNSIVTEQGWDASYSCTQLPSDCHGDPGGTAFIDSCGVCAGGNTGVTPNDCGSCQPNEVTQLILHDVNTGTDLGPLTNGQVINLNSGAYSVRADARDPQAVGSVRFFRNGSYFKNENSAPYTINGDNTSGYHAWNPTVGTFNLTATPFSNGNGNGTTGVSKR
ncbi:MAG: Ig-like domain-containing protein [Owenweeksia sp.]|nr:Ig-like domain-containing protein [Owenweeksia sp.]